MLNNDCTDDLLNLQIYVYTVCTNICTFYGTIYLYSYFIPVSLVQSVKQKLNLINKVILIKAIGFIINWFL